MMYYNVIEVYYKHGEYNIEEFNNKKDLKKYLKKNVLNFFVFNEISNLDEKITQDLKDTLKFKISPKDSYDKRCNNPIIIDFYASIKDLNIHDLYNYIINLSQKELSLLSFSFSELEINDNYRIVAIIKGESLYTKSFIENINVVNKIPSPKLNLHLNSDSES